MFNKVFCLMGPTAAGKTAYASSLYTHFPFEIISVDSAMVYCGMNIGTAKPTPAELLLTPHHLIDVLNPPESFSVAEFCTNASSLCDDIFSRGKIPLLVGGTMMYFHALQQGLSSLPEADISIRAQLLEEASLIGWEAMHTKLNQVDPITALKIHANDTQRIQRALEVYHLTGKPLSSFLAQMKSTSPYHFINLILMPYERAWLHERIAKRFAMMLEQGFVAEVESLVQTWQLPANSPSMRCVGYRQAYDYLQGLDNYSSFCDKGVAATRQLAKRQLTWLRHWKNATLIECDKPGTHAELMAIIRKILDN